MKGILGQGEKQDLKKIQVGYFLSKLRRCGEKLWIKTSLNNKQEDNYLN